MPSVEIYVLSFLFYQHFSVCFEKELWKIIQSITKIVLVALYIAKFPWGVAIVTIIQPPLFVIELILPRLSSDGEHFHIGPQDVTSEIKGVRQGQKASWYKPSFCTS